VTILRRRSLSLPAAGNGPGATLLRGAAGSLALNVVYTAMTLGVSILLARVLGVEEYGVFAFVSATILLLIVPAVLGLDRLLIREVSVYASRGSFALLRGLVLQATGMVVVLSIAIGLAVGIGAWILGGSVVTPALVSLWIGLLSLPLSALARTSQSTLMGMGNVVLAQVAELLLRPTAFLVLAAGFAMTVGLNAQGALWLQLVAVAGGLALSLVLLFRAFPRAARGIRPSYLPKAWLQSSLELAFLSGASVVNAQTGTFLLGAMRSPAEAGLYAVGTRGALLISFGLLAVNTALAPAAARMWADRDIPGLQHITTVSSRAALLFSLPIAIVFIVWGRQVLQIAFGADYGEATGALAILSIGQLINAGIGSVGTLLIMTGHQREAAAGILVGAGLNVVVGVALVPSMGVIGAAVAGTISIAVWNILLAAAAIRRVGVHSTALGPISLRRRLRGGSPPRTGQP
jgi:O-antigen/teichoic acid export membrane protein